LKYTPILLPQSETKKTVMTSMNDRSNRWSGGGPNVEETQHMGRYGPVVLGWLK
jgi:hypothetical protein